MNTQIPQIGLKEVRFLGTCHWCNTHAVSLRDYLCYDAIKPCCYTLYHRLPPKVYSAVRLFPYRKVNIETQFDTLVDKFYECVMKDRRFIRENEESIRRIEKTLAEYRSDLKDFLRFVVRLLIVRGIIDLKSKDDFIKQHCILCGRLFSNNWKVEICPTCIETIGQPPEKMETDAPISPENARPQGMHYRKK